MARLFRHHAQPAVLDVLTPQSHHIAAAHAEVEQQRQGEPRLGADRVLFLELPDLVDRPGMKSRSGVADLADLARRVTSSRRDVDRRRDE